MYKYFFSAIDQLDNVLDFHCQKESWPKIVAIKKPVFIALAGLY